MAEILVNPLCSLDDVKSALYHGNITANDTDDDRIALNINASSRLIEDSAHRVFELATQVSSRVFVPATPFLCEVDDFQTLSGLIVQTDPYGDGTFSDLWQTADYQLEPLNGLSQGRAWPYTKIRAVRSMVFPMYAGIAVPIYGVQALVQVTALWGWTTIPIQIRKAAIVQTISLLKADDTPFGATAFAEMGVVRMKASLHPTAQALIDSFNEQTVMVA